MARSHSLCLASPARDALVTLGLVGAGATFGALAGGTALAVAVFIADHEDAGLGFIVGALFGAPVGSVVAPIVALSLLRRVPLGRMFAVCSIGTAIGGIVGALTAPLSVEGGLGGALVGCLVAALMLRRWTAHRLES